MYRALIRTRGTPLSWLREKSLISLHWFGAVDLGCNNLAEFQRCLAIWSQWPILVCEWGHRSGAHLLCCFSCHVIEHGLKLMLAHYSLSNFLWRIDFVSQFSCFNSDGHLFSGLQVLLFGVLAIEIKRKAPAAHTICEIIKARWGFEAHMVFLCFCFMTNIIVTAMLLLGGSAVVNSLTGMNLSAASFLIPLGVIVYTLAGGLKATFLASYIHSIVGMKPSLQSSFVPQSTS